MADIPLSNALGRGYQPPVGGVALLTASGPNPTLDGAEYLKTSVLKPIGGYEHLAGSMLEVIVGTAGTNALSSGLQGVVGGNGYFYVAGTSGSLWFSWTTSLSTAFAAVGGSAFSQAATDMFMAGNRCVRIGTGLSNVESVLAATLTTNAVSPSPLCGASNPSGSLATAASSLAAGAGNIYTSTDGFATLTSRNPSGGAGTPRLATWSPVGNCFIYLADNGRAYTTTDGFTLTDRGAIGGATAVADAFAIVRGVHCASSSTSTLIVATLTISGVATACLIRTTNGTSFTATPINSLVSFDGFGGSVSQLLRADNRYYMFGSPHAGALTSAMFVSNDDGLTWARSPAPVCAASPTSATVRLCAANGVLFGVANNSASHSITTYSSLAAGTHVGIPAPIGSGASATGLPYYVRIK